MRNVTHTLPALYRIALIVIIIMAVYASFSGVCAATVTYTGVQGVKAGDSNKGLYLSMLDESSDVSRWEIASGIVTNDSIEEYCDNTILEPLPAEEVRFIIGVAGTGANAWSDSDITANILPNIRVYETDNYDEISSSNLAASYNDGLTYTEGTAINYGAGAPIVPVSVDKGRLKSNTWYMMVCDKSLYVRQSAQPLGIDIAFRFRTSGGDEEKISQQNVTVTLGGEVTSMRSALQRYEAEDIRSLTVITQGQETVNLSDFSFIADALGGTLQKLDMESAQMSIDEIPRDEWSKFTALEELKASPSVVSVPEVCFFNNHVLKTVSLPGAETVKQVAFAGCSSLETVSLPKATNIMFHAFYNCPNLKSIDFRSVETIGNYAFSGDAQLNIDTFPASLHQIDQGAFEGCTGLGKDGMIYWKPAEVPILGQDVFLNSSLPGLKNIVPAGSYNKYKSAWSEEAWADMIYPDNYSESADPEPAAPVKPAAPSITAARYSYNGIKISWKAVSGASGYQIYRASSRAGTYKLVKTASSGSRSYVNTGLTTGTSYFYKVRAYKTAAGGKVYGAFSSVKSAKPTLSTPAAPTVTRYSSGYVKVRWKGISGESGYQVYRSASKTGSYTKVKSVTMTSSSYPYAKIKATKGKTYYYKVRAYKKIGSRYVYSSFSTVKSYKLK